jgi:hypothetical protein
MSRMRCTGLLALVFCAAVLGACSRDPEVAKREFVASGDALVADKKYREAIVQYLNAVRLDAGYSEARFKLATAYELSGPEERRLSADCSARHARRRPL